MRVLGNVYNRLRQRIATRHAFIEAKRRLLSSMDLTEEEKNLLNRVSLQVDDADSMFEGDAVHYLSVGISATRCIQAALTSTREERSVDNILDFPCGHGRVLRFLRAMFPDSNIVAGEIDNAALKFCSRNFSATTVLSTKVFSDVSLTQRFDVIWCGSLFTHIDEQSTKNLLKFFYEHLLDHGVCFLLRMANNPSNGYKATK